jgi:hypothetical protein
MHRVGKFLDVVGANRLFAAYRASCVSNQVVLHVFSHTADGGLDVAVAESVQVSVDQQVEPGSPRSVDACLAFHLEGQARSPDENPTKER